MIWERKIATIKSRALVMNFHGWIWSSRQTKGSSQFIKSNLDTIRRNHMTEKSAIRNHENCSRLQGSVILALVIEKSRPRYDQSATGLDQQAQVEHRASWAKGGLVGSNLQQIWREKQSDIIWAGQSWMKILALGKPGKIIWERDCNHKATEQWAIVTELLDERNP